MVPGNGPRGRSHGTIFFGNEPSTPSPGTKTRDQNQGPKPGTKTRDQNLGAKPEAKTRDQNQGPKFKTEEELHELRIHQRTI